ncbi:MAG TPA: flippase [Natronoarchaeum rubrum]|nr:flippase [Natronoarchaeum rubrum]
MSLIDRFSRGLSATFLSRGVKMVANAALLVVLARYLLSPDEYGLLYLTISIVGVARLFSDLGLGRSTARYVNEYKDDDDGGQLHHVLRIGFTARFALVVVAALGLLIGGGLIADLVGQPDLRPYLVVGALYLAAISFQSFFSVLFQGFSRVTLAACVGITNSLARVVFAVGFVLLGLGGVGALLGYVVAAALAAIVGAVILYTQLYVDYEPDSEREEGLRRRILEYSVPLTATRSANTIDKRVDTILVGTLAGPAAAGFYTVGKQVSAFLDVPARSIGFTVSPAYGEEKANGEYERAARMYEASLRYVLLLYVPAATGLLLVADPGITLVFGQDYAAATLVVQVMSVYVVFQAINLVTTQGLDYLGRARERAIGKGITAAGNVVLNLLLIPPYGAAGAAMATVLTFGFYVAGNVYVMHTELPLRWGRLVRTAAQVVAVSAGMALGVALVMPRVSSMASLIGAIGLGVAIWVALSIASGLLDVGEARTVLSRIT